MSKSKKPSDFLQVPQYKGGNKALKKFIDANLRYPQEALDNKIEGAVEVEYFIDGLGKIGPINILNGIGHGCDEEVIRLISMLVYQKAINRGMKTRTRKSLTVNFKLPVPPKTTIQYQIVKEKSKTPKKEEKPVSSYTIKLDIGKG